MAHKESQGLVTASTDSPRQGMKINRVQHPAREFNQDQKETDPETGLETSVPCEFKPAQETEPKTGLEISFSLHLRSDQVTSYLQHGLKVYPAEKHHCNIIQAKTEEQGPSLSGTPGPMGRRVVVSPRQGRLGPSWPVSAHIWLSIGLSPVLTVMLLPRVFYLDNACSYLHCQGPSCPTTWRQQATWKGIWLCSSI